MQPRAPPLPRLDDEHISGPIRVLVVASGRLAIAAVGAIVRCLQSSGHEAFATTLPPVMDGDALERVLANGAAAVVVMCRAPPPRWVASRFDIVMSSPAASPEAIHRCAFRGLAPVYASFERSFVSMPREKLIAGDFRQAQPSSGSRLMWFGPS